jgi:hypothetical protein
MAKLLLNEWLYDEYTTEKTPIRFAYLDPKRRRLLLQQNVPTLPSNWIPVFLGTDVLHFNASEAQSNSNACRVHGRYGKLGLACKLTFPAGQRPSIVGGTNAYWFYSVQGIFKLASDLGTRQLQLECYDNFMKLWRERLSDDLLSPDIELVEVVREKDGDAGREFEFIDSSVCGENGTHSVAEAVPVEIPITNMPVVSRTPAALQWLNCVYHTSETKSTSCRRQSVCSSLINTLYEYCGVLSHTGWESWETDSDTQILCGVATWLGEQLKLLEKNINDRGETFKSREIHKIENTTECHKFLLEVFHPAMVILLARWMGIIQSDIVLDKQQGKEKDTDPCPKIHRASSRSSDDELFWNSVDKTKEFRIPVLQTTLEFITASLLSGKAMVLYSFIVPNTTS